VPLVGLAGLFHYAEWVPRGMGERIAVREGMERFGRYFGRKGWFGFSRESNVSMESGRDEKVEMDGQTGRDKEGMILETEKRWSVGEKGGRILVEVATAYAITKVLLPVRILVSVWATPWFARVVVGRVGGLFGRGKSTGTAGLGSKSAAGTGKTSAGALGKSSAGAKKIP
jgi:hypothetical protein